MTNSANGYSLYSNVYNRNKTEEKEEHTNTQKRNILKEVLEPAECSEPFSCHHCSAVQLLLSHSQTHQACNPMDKMSKITYQILTFTHIFTSSALCNKVIKIILTLQHL